MIDLEGIRARVAEDVATIGDARALLAYVDALRELMKESRHVIQYAFDGESADDPHDADENKMYSETLARIDAALLNPEAPR
jgi:hypothetical protein